MILWMLIFCFTFVLSQSDASSEAKDETPLVLLISLDGFRYDYPDRGITPAISEFAETGVRALSLKPVFPSSTFPNHISMLTGVKPTTHGIIANDFLNPFTGELYSYKNNSIHESKWYKSEFFWEYLRRYNIKSASYFWPGSEIELAERRPDFFEKYDHERDYLRRVNGVMEWLLLADSVRPKFVTLYFDAADSYGHSHGTDSDTTNMAIAMLDSMISTTLNKIDIMDYEDKLNVIIVSDHGMMNIDSSKLINLTQLVDTAKAVVQNWGPYAMVQPLAGEDLSPIYKSLDSQEGFSVYHKRDIPERYGLSRHPFVSDLFLVADAEHMFDLGASTLVGMHGWDNQLLEMHGIFMARGPAFKSRMKIGSVNNLDIFPLLCRIYGLPVPPQLDGNADNIEYILNESFLNAR